MLDTKRRIRLSAPAESGPQGEGVRVDNHGHQLAMLAPTRQFVIYIQQVDAILPERIDPQDAEDSPISHPIRYGHTLEHVRSPLAIRVLGYARKIRAGSPAEDPTIDTQLPVRRSATRMPNKSASAAKPIANVDESR